MTLFGEIIDKNSFFKIIQQINGNKLEIYPLRHSSESGKNFKRSN